MEALSQGHAVVTITVETEGCNISETTTLVAYSPLKVWCSCVRACVCNSMCATVCVRMICGKCHVCIKGDLSALWWLFIKIINCLGVAED